MKPKEGKVPIYFNKHGRHWKTLSQLFPSKCQQTPEKLRFLSFTSLKDNQITRALELKSKCQFHQCVCVCSVISNSLQPHGLQATRLLCPWNFPGKNAGAGCHFLLQGIFLIYGSKQHLLHWQVDSLPLRHIGLNKVFIRLWKPLIQKTTSGEKALSYLGQILNISPLFSILQSCIFSKNVSNF